MGTTAVGGGAGSGGRASSDLRSLIDDAASSAATIRFGDAAPTGLGSMWGAASAASAAVAATVPEGHGLGVVLTNCREAVELVWAAWQAQCPVVSLPVPARGQDIAAYLAGLERIRARAGCPTIAIPDALTAFVPEVGYAGYTEVLSGRGGVAAAGEAVGLAPFVQFTSGSTGDPTGVGLTLEQLGANVEAMLARIEPQPDDSVCSWLPLSHDMGLVGVLLTSVVGAGRRWSGRGTLVIDEPTTFLADPFSWLRRMEEVAATITAAPDFALRRTAERLDQFPGHGVRLDSLRVCITGSERVQPSTVTAFQGSLRSARVAGQVVCPAYGLAEVGLGVSMHPPGTDVVVVDHDGVEVVACGPPLDGYTVEVAEPGPLGVGEITVSGPSVSHVRVGAPDVAAGPLATGDVGFVDEEGVVFVLSRLDEVVNVGGRKVHLPDVDRAASAVPGVRSGRAVAIPTSGHDGFAVVVESGGGPPDDRLTRSVRVAVMGEVGCAPDTVLWVESGAIPKTPSGKPRRHELSAKVEWPPVD